MQAACCAIGTVCKDEREQITNVEKETLALECEQTRLREALAESYGIAAEARLRKNVGKDLAEEGWWKWPVRIIASGWSSGRTKEQLETPLYFPPEIMPQIARAAEGVKFRRRHPTGWKDEPGDSQLVAGWISEARVVEESAARSAVYANVNLYKDERFLRAQLMAARDDLRLDLFGISHDAIFGVKRSKIQGRPALVATSLKKLVGVDLAVGTPAGSGGRFLEVATPRETFKNIFALQKSAEKRASVLV